jgi:hypothetical protein
MRYAMRLLALAGTAIFVVLSLIITAVLIKFYTDAYRYFGRFSIYEVMRDTDLKLLILTTAASVSLGFLYRRLVRSAHQNSK